MSNRATRAGPNKTHPDKASPNRPERHNWRLFCQEPPLTEEEWERWNQAAAAMRNHNDCFDYVVQATEAEHHVLFQEINPVTDGWGDMVQEADAGRVLKRAEIRAVEAWEREHAEAT